jgi:hypothetical protein
LTPTHKFDGLIGFFRDVLQTLPDKRTGKNRQYSMADAGLSAFSLFFTQSPSFLSYQRTMADTKGKSNAQSLFGVHQIPCDNQIRDLLDGVAPPYVFPVFEEILRMLDAAGRLSAMRAVEDTLLVAMDGVEYFSSPTIHCPHCSTQTAKDGTVRYFHVAVTPVIVSPGRSTVLPLPPEFVLPQDGHAKQDCEIAAAKRWLTQHAETYRAHRITVLGDDLYCHQPFCEALRQASFHFILVCLPDSHQTLYEHLDGIALPTVVRQRWTGKTAETATYRYLNQVPLRDDDDALLVNWCELTITRADGQQLYKNAFATDHWITDQTVEAIVQSGRTRWKVENEHNNTLKTKGYNLEHNFGHGKQHLASLLATFNLLSLLFHTLLELLDDKYRLLRQHLPTRKTFFDDLRALTRYLLFESWDHLLTFMIEGLELELPLNSS